MTPSALMDAPPRLFPLDEPTLEDAVLRRLTELTEGGCLVCGGDTEGVVGGVRCRDCGSELVVGGESADEQAADVASWVA